MSQSGGLGQLYALGPAGQHRLSADVDRDAGDRRHAQLAADGIGRLEYYDVGLRRALGDTPRRRQPGDAPTDHDDTHHVIIPKASPGFDVRPFATRRPASWQVSNARRDASAERPDQLGDALEHVRVGVGQHPVPEVEDVPGRGTTFGDDPARLTLDDGPVGEQQRRVEIALYHCTGPEPPRCLVQRHPPIDADHVRAGLAHQCEQLTGTDAEVDARYLWDGRQYSLAVR